MANNSEIGITYHPVPANMREEYEALIGNLTREAYLKDIEDKSEDFMTAVQFMLQATDPRTGKTIIPNLALDTYTAESFYLYAVEGIPRFLMRSENGSLREQTPEELHPQDFSLDLNTFLSFNQGFTAFEESWGNPGPAVSLILVLNQFRARMKLDASEYSGEENYLSIPEVALLAGMREKSVRNLATKELGATFDRERHRTVVAASRALAWLEGRRKFTPSQRLKTPAAIQAFLQIQYDLFG